jgi:hypothetical protein
LKCSNLLVEEASEAEDGEAEKKFNDEEEDDEFFPLEVGRRHAEAPADAGEDGQQEDDVTRSFQRPGANVEKLFLFVTYKLVK